MCECEAGRSEFDDCRKVVAQKDYECGECHEPIPYGTKYLYSVGKWVGDTGAYFWTFRMCLRCRSDWGVLSDIQYEATRETCVVYGCLKKKVGEAFDEGHFNELIEEAKRPFCEGCHEGEGHNLRTEEFESRIALLKRWLPEALQAEDNEPLEFYRPTEADGQPNLPLEL